MIGIKKNRIEKAQQLELFEDGEDSWLKDYWNDFSDSLGRIIVTFSFRLILAIIKTIHIGMKVFINEMTVDFNRRKDYEG